MSGGGDKQSTKFDPPEWTADYYPGAMDTAAGLASTPYEQFQGMKIAPINPWQSTAGALTADRALWGDPQSNAARGSLMSISQGGGMNPYADNAYTDQMIADSANDMATGFATGTAAQNDASAARAGAFGGSGHQLKQQADAAGLADRIGRMATGTRQQDLARQGGLWQQDIGNILAASGMAPAFSQQDQSSFDSLNRYGGQQQDYTKQLLNEQYGEFQRQQNYPMTMMDWFMSNLAKGSGQYGTNFAQGAGQSGAMNAVGGGLGLLGTFLGGGGG